MSCVYHYIFNQLDLELLTARIIGIFVYFFTYAFDFKHFLALFSTNINIADEIIISIVRLVSAVLSAITILFFTDVYKYFKEKLYKKLNNTSKETKSEESN